MILQSQTQSWCFHWAKTHLQWQLSLMSEAIFVTATNSTHPRYQDVHWLTVEKKESLYREILTFITHLVWEPQRWLTNKAAFRTTLHHQSYCNLWSSSSAPKWSHMSLKYISEMSADTPGELLLTPCQLGTRQTAAGNEIYALKKAYFSIASPVLASDWWKTQIPLKGLMTLRPKLIFLCLHLHYSSERQGKDTEVCHINGSGPWSLPSLS